MLLENSTGIFLGMTTTQLDPPLTPIEVSPSDKAAFMAYSMKGRR